MHARAAGTFLAVGRARWIHRYQSWASRCSAPCTELNYVLHVMSRKGAGPGFPGIPCISVLYFPVEDTRLSKSYFFLRESFGYWNLRYKIILDQIWKFEQTQKKLTWWAGFSSTHGETSVWVPTGPDWDPEFGLLCLPARRRVRLSGYSSLHFIISDLWNKVFFHLHKGAFSEIPLSGKREKLREQLPLEICVNILV